MTFRFFVKTSDAFLTHSTKAECIAVDLGEMGYLPIFTGANVENMNHPPLPREVIDSAIMGSMAGWDCPGAKPAIEWAKKQMGYRLVVIQATPPRVPEREGPNAKRIKRADRVLAEYQRLTGDEYRVRDLLTDLMHLCQDDGVDFSEELDVAREHYYEEATA